MGGGYWAILSKTKFDHKLPTFSATISNSYRIFNTEGWDMFLTDSFILLTGTERVFHISIFSSTLTTYTLTRQIHSIKFADV